jgi:hypothetical protein
MELQVSSPNKGQSCKCPNRAYIRLDNNGLPVIVAEDISQVEMVSGFVKPKQRQPIYDQVNIPKRKVRKLDYEVR